MCQSTMSSQECRGHSASDSEALSPASQKSRELPVRITHVRSHNSCVDFSFLQESASGNSKKLTRLNALFQRVADRRSGGIRAEKLRRLLPPTSTDFSASKYQYLLGGQEDMKPRKKKRGKKKVVPVPTRVISRGPFLAMFEHESNSFISALMANEKAMREQRQAQRRTQLYTNKKSQAFGQNAKSSVVTPKSVSPQNNGSGSVTSGGSTRERAHTAPCASELQGFEDEAGVESDGNSMGSSIQSSVQSTNHRRCASTGRRSSRRRSSSSSSSRSSTEKRSTSRRRRESKSRNQNGNFKERRQSFLQQNPTKDLKVEVSDVPALEGVKSYGSTSMGSTSASEFFSDTGRSHLSEGHFFPNQGAAYSQVYSTYNHVEYDPYSRRGGTARGEYSHGNKNDGECCIFSSVSSFFRDLFSPPKRRQPVLINGYYYNYPVMPGNFQPMNTFHDPNTGAVVPECFSYSTEGHNASFLLRFCCSKRANHNLRFLFSQDI